MNIIIIGCGKIGATLAEQLSQEKYDITVIDLSRSKLQRVADNFDVMGFVGNGTSFQLLEEAGIASADVLIAVTGSDEVNLLCCVIAKKAGSNITTIARVRDFTYFKERDYLQKSLGISMIINPELTAATEIARLLRTPKAIEISTFARGRAELLTFSLEGASPLVGMPLVRMNQKLGTDVLVCAVERENKVLIPRGDFVFRRGDTVSIAGSPRNTSHFFQRIGMSAGQVRDVMIVGGGQIAYYLAYQLAPMNFSIKIIEADQSRCEALSESLPEAMIIHGSSLNREVLMEEGLESAQGIVALTNLDEENLMLSMLSSIYNPNAKLVTKVSRMPFGEVLQRLRVGSMICPKELTALHILQYVRAMNNTTGSNVETLYRVLDNKAEALEFRLSAPSPILDIPLQDLNLRPDVIISTIIRSGRAFNPRGSDRLLLHDSVIVVTTHSGLRDILDILKPGPGRGALRSSAAVDSTGRLAEG